MECKIPIHHCSIDPTKAYDSVERAAMAVVLKPYRVPQQLVEIIQDLYRCRNLVWLRGIACIHHI